MKFLFLTFSCIVVGSLAPSFLVVNGQCPRACSRILDEVCGYNAIKKCYQMFASKCFMDGHNCHLNSKIDGLFTLVADDDCRLNVCGK